MTDPAADPGTGQAAAGDDADGGAFSAKLDEAIAAKMAADAESQTTSTAEGEAPEGGPAEGASGDAASIDGASEDVDPLVAMTAERDGYIDALQRLKAEFDNHRRRNGELATQQREQAAAGLVEKILPVLDACEAALVHDADAVKPINDQLIDALTAQGLAMMVPAGESFDPELHEAVLHEEGDGDDGPVVAEVLRTGYSWNGRVIRPAMVKVRG